MANNFNRIEEKILKQVNLTEGFLSKLFGMLAQKPLTRDLGKAIKIANDDPEVKAALSDFQKQRERTLDLMASYCLKNPDSSLCYGKFAKRFGFEFKPDRKKGAKVRYRHKGKYRTRR
tara:strand:+ start:411 stop:764 length:354 start_codon:yes stop_codon:yes gene_type:complete